MSNSTRDTRVSGGRVPSQTLTALYFFGPFLVEELERYRYDIAREAQETSTPEVPAVVPPARISYNSLSSFCSISLPRNFTVPFPRAHRKGEGFEFVFERKLFSRLSRSLTSEATPDTLILRRALADENYSKVWQLSFSKHLGTNFRMLPSYVSLMADMVTIAAGIELLLYQHWTEEGRLLVREAPRILRDLDDAMLDHVAVRTGVSIGVVMAAVVQLAGRKQSPLIRASLEKSNWDPLHDALWTALLPNYKTHPYFSLFLEKLQNPDLKSQPGRKAVVPVGPQEPKRPVSTKTSNQGRGSAILPATESTPPTAPIKPAPTSPAPISQSASTDHVVESDYKKEQRL